MTRRRSSVQIGELQRARSGAFAGFLALLTGFFALASCTPSSGSPSTVRPGTLVLGASVAAHSTTAKEQTVVLIAIDGVRWQEVFRGVDRRLAARERLAPSELLGPKELMPNLHALMAGGAALGHTGREIAASGPNFVSVPGYMEMLSGRRPTGCLYNHCAPIRVPTLADEFAASAESPLEVAVIASWEGIERAAARTPSRIALSVGRTRGPTRDRLRYDPVASALVDAGEHAGPEPGHDDFRRDHETAALALHYLRSGHPRFLFVGLGEPDEYAHDNDYRGYLKAVTYADYVIGHIAAALHELENDGRRVTLFVTTDHGRSHEFTGHGADAPESASVWLVAHGWGIERKGLVTPPRPRHLASLASTIRVVCGMAVEEHHSEPLYELLRSPEAQDG